MRLLLEIGRASDRKSTRLNSSHLRISYAGFCLKKELLAGPFGEGGAGLERSVGDVGDGIGRVETMRGAGEGGVDGALLFAMAAVGFGLSVVFQVRENFAAGSSWGILFPLRANGGERGAGFSLGGRGGGQGMPGRKHYYAGHGFCGGG